MLTTNEKKIEALFEELVPASGAASTVAGEITRAINRICYRCFNDGDHLGVGYGRETCNPAGRYLAAKCDGKVAAMIKDDVFERLSDMIEYRKAMLQGVYSTLMVTASNWPDVAAWCREIEERYDADFEALEKFKARRRGA
ncbi:MAG: hypothetical protein J6M06_03885 [Synergistaceae bacterium]|nr:hypothetical protein [Synergistaceae bacterium]